MRPFLSSYRQHLILQCFPAYNTTLLPSSAFLTSVQRQISSPITQIFVLFCTDTMAQPFPGPMAPPSDTRGPLLIQCTWSMASIATAVLVARVVARIKHRGKLEWDDYLMILSLVSTFHGNRFTLIFRCLTSSSYSLLSQRVSS